MNEEVKKKNKIIGISIGILVVLLIVISSTYAYWQITAHQDDTNILKAACLNFEVDFTTGITFEDEWPLPVNEALSDLKGYKFTITNHCQDEVNYEIGLESLFDAKITDYMEHEYVALAIDDYFLGTYNLLENLEGPSSNKRASKKLMTSTLGAGEVKDHILKIWIDESAPVETQSKGFAGKLFITGGPGIENNVTAQNCFGIDENTGEIISFDASCGTSVVLPAKVGTTTVKSIDSNAFKNVTTSRKTYSPSGEEVSALEASQKEFSVNFTSYNFGDMEPLGEPSYIIIYNKTRQEDYMNFAEAMEVSDVYLYDDENLPSRNNGEAEMYFALSGEEPQMLAVDEIIVDTRVIINSLDLSKAYNLEKIEERAFSNVPAYVDNISDLANYPISLTSLNFGTNYDLEIGPGAFSRIDVPELTLYASFVPGNLRMENPKEINIAYFGFAEVDKLTIKPGNSDVITDKTFTFTYEGESTDMNLGIYLGIKAEEMIIEEGIKEIKDDVFSGAFGLVLHTGEKLTLPNSLNKIGATAFYNIPFNNVYLGTGLISIGERAFYGMNSSQVINVPKTQVEFESSTTRGNNWSGEATINYTTTNN